MPSALWHRYSTLSQFAALGVKELEVMISNPLQSQSLRDSLRTQTLQNTVQQAITGDDVEKNDRGELSIHGQTMLAWTSAVPGGP